MCSFVRVFALIAVAGAIGCGSESTHIEKVVPVSGTLTYRGKPLNHFQVTLMPEDGRRPAVGVTDAQGKFKLGTNGPDDGAPPGLSKVAVVWVAPASSAAPGSEPVIDDPSKMPKPPINLPAKYNDPATSELTQDVPASGLSDWKLDLK